MRISDWSSDVCSSDLNAVPASSRPAASNAVDRRRPCSREVAALGIVVLKVHQGANGTASRHLAPAAAGRANRATAGRDGRSEEHTSELQSLMRISYAVFCLKKKNENILHLLGS